MKRIINFFICCLLFINIISINNYVYAEEPNYLTIKVGNNTVVYSYDGLSDVSILQGEPIVGLNVEGQIDEGREATFVITPTTDLVLNDFSLNTSGSISFVLEHNLTINGTIKESSDVSDCLSIFYVRKSLEVIGDHTFTINYDIDKSLFDTEDHTTKYQLCCIYSSFFSFVGNDSNGPIININDNTDKDIVKYITEGNAGVPLFALHTGNYKSPYIKNATLNIKSYLFGIGSQKGLRVNGSTINLLRKGYEEDEDDIPKYIGIYCETFGLSMYKDSKISIQEDDNCGKCLEEVYGIASSNPSSIEFERCKLNIDLSKSNGQTFKIEYEPDTEETNSIRFNDTYANIKGYLDIPKLTLGFEGDNCSVYFTSKTTPINTTPDTGSMIDINNKKSTPNVAFETTDSNYRWAQGFDHYYGMDDDVVASEEVKGFKTDSLFDGSKAESYRWVARRSNFHVKYIEGFGAEFDVDSFKLIPNPGEPEGHEEDFLGWFYVDNFNDEVRFDYQDYVRCNMDLYPKWKEKSIDSFEIKNFEYLYLSMDASFEIDTDNYHCDNENKYAFKNGECLYYGDFSGIYDNKTEQYVEPDMIAFESDTYVYKYKIDVIDTKQKFDDNAIVKVNGSIYPKLSENKVIERESTGNFDDSYNGYLILDDGASILFQFVTAVPEPYYVDTLEIEHDGFDFETYSIDISLPDTHRSFNDIVYIMLIKDGEIKYLIVSADGMRMITDHNGDEVEFEEISPDDVDSAVVSFALEPTAFGPLFDESSKILVNDVLIKQTTDESIFVGMEGGITENITKDVEACMINEDSEEELLVQLYFSRDEESIELTKVPLTLPTKNSEGNLPYYTDGEGNYFEDPKGERQISNIDEFKIAKISKEVSVGTYVNKNITLLDNKTINRPVTNNNYLFKSEANYDDFVCVIVNDKVLSSGFDVAEGSTLVRFNDEFIKNTLKEGKNNIYIVSKNETAYGEFTVKTNETQKPEEHHSSSGGSNYSIPKTGIK